MAASPSFKREKYGEIDQLAVTGSYRRKGIGKMLYARIIKWFSSKNIDRVELQTTTKNPLANSFFWQKHGFETYQNNQFKKIK